MTATTITLTALDNFPLVRQGDDLSELIIEAIQSQELQLADRDILVIAQKIVSKAEGRFVDLATIQASKATATLAAQVNKDPRLVEVILSESTDVIAYKKDVLIVRHRAGYIMANAGIDQSNVGAGDAETVLLLPLDADASAERIKERLDGHFGVNLGVVINDSFGRPWRNGVVGVALGSAGLPALQNLVGEPDLFGRRLKVTEVAVADEIAAAASLLMGQGDEGRPVIHIAGLALRGDPQPASRLIRSKETDMFR